MNLTFPVSGDNYGGVDRFWFIHEDDIGHVDFFGRVIPQPGRYYSIGRGTKFTIEHSNPANPNRGGVVYSPQLRATVKKYRPELESILHSMRGERFAVIYKDKNGYLVQVGQPNELLTFSTEQGTGGMPFDPNAYNIRFAGDTKREPVRWFGRIPVSPGSPEEPVVGLGVIIIVNGQQVGILPPGSAMYITTDFTLEFVFPRQIIPGPDAPPVGAYPVGVFFNGSIIDIVPAGSTYVISSDFTFTYTTEES
jgi:hypothetical protein